MKSPVVSDRIETSLKRIERKLSSNVPTTQRPKWVKVSFIKQATGWTADQLKRARQQAIITYKKDANGIWYDLNSIPTQLLKNALHD